MAINPVESVADNSHSQGKSSRIWPFGLAATVCAFLYSIHLYRCQQSSLQFLDALYTYSDMHANLMWARGIREQGWLNPLPYHPWADWMQAIAPYPQWVKWWGGEQIFQQSPLYAYLVGLFLPNYFLIRVFQALLHTGTCVFLGLLTDRVAGRVAGWIAFWLAALYAPFYAYSWPFLRDGLGWFLTAATLWALTVLTQADWTSERSRWLAWATGVLLGVGFLARETFLLVIPLALFVLCLFAWKRGQWKIVARVGIGTVLAITPLLIRNHAVNAPLLSTSTRFVETFIHGNAHTAHPYFFLIPTETGQILEESNGKALPAIRATIASFPNGVWGWLGLQRRKALSLLDPFESPDNLSIYFVATISPVVRFGLKYWMILVPACAGLLLSVWRRERAQMWLWIFLPVVLASVFVGVPGSRYRQSLAVFLIPFAAYFCASLWVLIRRHEFIWVAGATAALLIGWGLVLGPFAKQPRSHYERPAEYVFAGWLYHRLGDEQRSNAMIDYVRRNFPGALPPNFSLDDASQGGSHGNIPPTH